MASSSSSSPEPRATQTLAWGCNSHGQLGNGQAGSDKATPAQVLSTIPGTICSVACGSSHTIACTEDGHVYSWGSGFLGGLGHGTADDQLSPKRILGLLESKRIVSVAAGMCTGFAVCDTGVVYSWGSNECGELGVGDNGARFAPVLIPWFVENGKKIREVVCGAKHTMFLTREGDLYTCGWGYRGQLGLGHRFNVAEPQRVPMPRKVSGVACGQKHTLAFTIDGDVYGWGSAGGGRLGIAKISIGNTDVPQIIPALRGKNVCAVACGAKHSVALNVFGEVYAWGENRHGEAGQGHTKVVDIPALVKFPSLSGRPLLMLASGANHVIMGTGGTQLFAWGKNKLGELGCGDKSAKSIPTPVLLPSNVTDVYCLAAGSHHAAVFSRLSSPASPSIASSSSSSSVKL